ncbi:MAG: hypothetical protein ISP91_14000 [Pseudomonadales bacterium]|jgi:thioredoxin-related protein|nr:hypothetical protein [Pseudomonadales bacterium]
MIKLLITFGLLVSMAGYTAPIPDIQDLESLAGEGESVCAIYIYRQGCPYCRALESEVLQPMVAGGEFEQFCMGRLDWEGGELTDFDGTATSSQAIVARYGVVVVPTIVFVDAAGRQLTDSLVGYQGSELYFALLRKRYRQAAL